MQKTLSMSITVYFNGVAVGRSRLQSRAQRLKSPTPRLASQFNAVIETGNDQQRENGGSNGAANDGRGHGPVKLTAFADANGYWQHASNQGKSGHDDGTQTFAACSHESLFAVHAFGF